MFVVVCIPGDMVITNDKYQATNTLKSIFEDQMVLTIKSVERYDLGSYRCIAKNSLGEVESNIRLYGKQYHEIRLFAERPVLWQSTGVYNWRGWEGRHCNSLRDISLFTVKTLLRYLLRISKIQPTIHFPHYYNKCSIFHTSQKLSGRLIQYLITNHWVSRTLNRNVTSLKILNK